MLHKYTHILPGQLDTFSSDFLMLELQQLNVCLISSNLVGTIAHICAPRSILLTYSHIFSSASAGGVVFRQTLIHKFQCHMSLFQSQRYLFCPTSCVLVIICSPIPGFSLLPFLLHHTLPCFLFFFLSPNRCSIDLESGSYGRTTCSRSTTQIFCVSFIQTILLTLAWTN